MTYPSLGSRLSLLIIIFRVSAGVLGNIDYQVDSGDLNVDFQAKSGDVSMAQEALYNSEVPAQARFHDGQASDSLVSGNQACPGPATLDIQSRSSDPRLDKNGDACKNGSPPTMEQKKKEHAPVDEDIIIPEAMPRWPSMQLQPNRQKCDHEIYSVPTCAMKEGARFISLFLYDLPACRPCR